MLMTFPNKDSLIRNLNERDVSEVFLIIANFKSLAGWNLIPLSNLTILLGPNSAGKSTIYDAIKIIRRFSDTNRDENGEPLWDGHRSNDGKDNPWLGFSMPFILDGRAETRSLNNALLHGYAPDTGIGNGDPDGHFNYQFILEGMLAGCYLHEKLQKTRFTIFAWQDENCNSQYDSATSYEIYLNDSLASELHRDESGNLGLDYVNINIYPIANRLIYYPSVQFRRSFSDVQTGDANLGNFLGHQGDIDFLNDFAGTIEYWVPDTYTWSLRKLPHGIYGKDTHHNYGSDRAAFGMVVALYNICYHRMLEYIDGIATEDIRCFDSEWHKYFEPSDYNRSTLDKLRLEAKKSHWLMSLEKLFKEKGRLLPIINRWLQEEAFLNSKYQLRVETTTELLDDTLEEYIKTKHKNTDGSTEIKLIFKCVISQRGRVFLVDNEERQLDFDKVGAGYSQVLPILIGLASRNTLLFKQPEVHLHPRLQARVADCFVETVFHEKQDHQSKIRIIETHSEHFVLRLLRRLRESSFDELFHSSLTVYPKDVAFVYLQPQESSTLVHHISVLPSGEFVEGWPDGFFDERDEDLWGTPSPRGR
jgi:predicted ATPase